MLEFPATPLDRIRHVVDLPKSAQVSGGIGLALDLPAQVAPVILVPAGHRVKPCQEPPRLVADFAVPGDRGLEARLGECVAVTLEAQPAALQRREPSHRRRFGNAAPRREGGFGMARGSLTSAEPILDLASTGPTLGQPVQPRLGLTDTTRGQITRGLPKLRPELPCPDRPDR